MTATTLPAASVSHAAPSTGALPSVPLRDAYRFGAGLPPAVRTVGALAALILAVTVTGLLLVGAALVLPVALVLAALTRRRGVRGERRNGWRPAPA